MINCLLTFSVPCLRRAASVEEEYEAAGGEVLLDNEDNDGWLATHGKPKGTFFFWIRNCCNKCKKDNVFLQVQKYHLSTPFSEPCTETKTSTNLLA